MNTDKYDDVKRMAANVGLTVDITPFTTKPTMDQIAFIRHGDAMCVGKVFNINDAITFIVGYTAATLYPPATEHISKFVRLRMRKV